MLALALLGACAAPASAGTRASTGTNTSAWSPPAVLSACAGVGPARAVFPRDSPTHATGAGAVVWSDARGCPQGAGTLLAELDAADLPGEPAYVEAASGRKLSLRAPIAAAPAPHGQIAIAGSGSGAARTDGQLVQGAAGGPFSTLGAFAGPISEGSLATGYLGDVALAAPSVSAAGRAGVQVAVERYFARALSPPRAFAVAGAVEALTVSLDFRTDAIVAWRQGGALYARDLPASGRSQPTQRLGAVGAAPRVSALISDDNRAIVAWSDERAGTTSVYLADSRSGVRFGRPRLLERFVDPGGLPDPSTSPRLVRLSSESVMLAWSGAQQGHWVVRTAAIDQHGLRQLATISDPRAEALLSDLAPGPAGEAIALWSEPQQGAHGLEPGAAAILAARGIDAYPGVTIFGAPEQVAPPGANADATLAFDPASDRALAIWRAPGETLDYAVRRAATR